MADVTDHGRGFSVTAEAVGKPELVAACINVTKPRGQTLMIGVCPEGGAFAGRFVRHALPGDKTSRCIRTRQCLPPCPGRTRQTQLGKRDFRPLSTCRPPRRDNRLSRRPRREIRDQTERVTFESSGTPNRTSTMKAMTWHGGANFTLDDIPDPEPAPGYVVVKVDTTGICGTDVHVTQGLFPKDPPQILGHECSGTIVEVGRGGCNRTYWSTRMHQPPRELLRVLVLPELESVSLRKPAGDIQRLLRRIYSRSIALCGGDTGNANFGDCGTHRTRRMLPIWC